ncbi:hypothetical protein AB0B21_39875 [Streptomyces rimosus]|uniref:hypothetical protein n=1 Tax=Streptomyces rimosus TaxID=1927 RepID=UPI0007C55CAA|nr:hypothetical protein [Streptomyces rimosus]
MWEGARGTVGCSYDFWARHRHTRSRLFPALHVVLAGLPEHRLQRRLDALARGVEGITIAVLVTTLPRLECGEPWYELAVDDCHRRLARYPQVFSRWPGRLPEGDGPGHPSLTRATAARVVGGC